MSGRIANRCGERTIFRGQILNQAGAWYRLEMAVNLGAYETYGRCGEEFKHPRRITLLYGGAYCPACKMIVAREQKER